MRLIDADAYLEALKNVPMVQEAIRKSFEQFPTIEAVPVVHGHWLVNMFFIECSECGESFPLEPQNYCPHCGAKMDEVTYDSD